MLAKRTALVARLLLMSPNALPRLLEAMTIRVPSLTKLPCGTRASATAARRSSWTR